MSKRLLGVLLTGLCVVALAACGGGSPPPPPKPVPLVPFEVRLQAGGHQPVAGREWPLTVLVTRGGQPLSGTVSYAFAVGGQVVARRPGGHFANGRFPDTLMFPPQATGQPLTLQVVVSTRFGRRTVDYPVQVQPAGRR